MSEPIVPPRIATADERRRLNALGWTDAGAGGFWLRRLSDKPLTTDEAMADVRAVEALQAPPPAPVDVSPTGEPLLPQRVVRALAVLWTVLGAIQAMVPEEYQRHTLLVWTALGAALGMVSQGLRRAP